MKKLILIVFLSLTLSGCKVLELYSKHPSDWEFMDLFWFIIITLAILWFGTRIYDIFFPRKKNK
jgi:hypothetical protein